MKLQIKSKSKRNKKIENKVKRVITMAMSLMQWENKSRINHNIVTVRDNDLPAIIGLIWIANQYKMWVYLE